MAGTCGAVTGALMVLGLKDGPVEAGDQKGRESIYHRVRQFAMRFAARNGSTVCRDLIRCDINTPEGLALARLFSGSSVADNARIHQCAAILTGGDKCCVCHCLWRTMWEVGRIEKHCSPEAVDTSNLPQAVPDERVILGQAVAHHSVPGKLAAHAAGGMRDVASRPAEAIMGFIDPEESSATALTFFSRETGLPLVAIVALLF